VFGGTYTVRKQMEKLRPLLDKITAAVREATTEKQPRREKS
jgi:hypothetical protein